MDKKVLYALIGGVAVVGAAIAYHFMAKGESAEDTLDDDLDELGSLELDENGRIKFEQFLKIFQICSFYGKTQFAERKKQLIAQRREALKAGDEKKYEEIVMNTVQEEEMLVQTKLMQIIDRLGISEQEFQMNTMYHGQDQRKGMQLMQMQQQTAAAMDDDKVPPLSK